MEQQEFKQITVTQTSPDTILCDGIVWYTRFGYQRMLGLSERSLASPYVHIKTGRAERMKFAGVWYYRVI